VLLLGLLAVLLLGLLAVLLLGLLAVLLLGRLVRLLPRLLVGRLLGLLLIPLLWLLTRLSHLTRFVSLTALLGLLATPFGRQELPRPGVAWSLFRDLVHPLAELLGVPTVLCSLVCIAALLTGEAGLLPGRLVLRRVVSRLLLSVLLLSVLLLFSLVLPSSAVLLTHSRLVTL
jgi:hypothetical protein